MKTEVYKRKVDKRDELLGSLAFCMLLTRMRKREDQLRRPTLDLRPRVAKCTGVDGAIC